MKIKDLLIKAYALMQHIDEKLAKVGVDKWLHFVAGETIAAAWAIWWPQAACYCLLPAIVAGLLKELFDEIVNDNGDSRDFFATLLGGLTIQMMVWL